VTAADPHREECTMKHTKKITILHSNDLHGDFLAEQVDENGFICHIFMNPGSRQKFILCISNL